MELQCGKDRNRTWVCLHIKYDGLAKKQQLKTSLIKRREEYQLHATECFIALIICATQVEEDLKKRKVRNWRETCKYRGLWNEIVKQAETHQGL